MFLQQLQIVVGYCAPMDRLTHGAPNTAITHHLTNTYTLVEQNYPFQIQVDQNEKSFDLRSIGHDTFDGQLTHNVSAHPKVNAKTGEFNCFGYNMEKPYIHYTLIDKNRKLINKLDVKITSMRMIHDFPITENYVILPDLPLEFKPEKAMKEGGFAFKFD
jgi:carotenoid cleavage dioxygenase